jgi:hypothetical protein
MSRGDAERGGVSGHLGTCGRRTTLRRSGGSPQRVCAAVRGWPDRHVGRCVDRMLLSGLRVCEARGPGSRGQ